MTTAEQAYEEISNRIIPDSARFFLAKSRDYRGGPAFQFLGAKGQFADINRKFWKLYQAIWQDKKLEGEPLEVVIKDMIGHLWLTLYCLEQEPSVFEDIMNDLDGKLATS